MREPRQARELERIEVDDAPVLLVLDPQARAVRLVVDCEAHVVIFVRRFNLDHQPMTIEGKRAGVELLADDGVHTRHHVVFTVGQSAPVFDRRRKRPRANDHQRRERIEIVAAPAPPDLECRAKRVLGEIEILDAIEIDAELDLAGRCFGRRRNMAGSRNSDGNRRGDRCGVKARPQPDRE